MGTSLPLVQKTVLVQKVLVLNIRTRDLDQTKAKTLIAKYYSPMPRLLLSFPWGHPCLMAPSRESVFIYLGASPKLGLSVSLADENKLWSSLFQNPGEWPESLTWACLHIWETHLGWAWSSEVEHWPSIHEGLGLTPHIAGRQARKKTGI